LIISKNIFIIIHESILFVTTLLKDKVKNIIGFRAFHITTNDKVDISHNNASFSQSK